MSHSSNVSETALSPALSPLPPLYIATAGALSGLFTNILLHPLDTVKTVRQTNPHLYPNLSSTALAILQTRGPAALYAGLAPALLGNTICTALYFGVYELVKRKISHRVPEAFQTSASRLYFTSVAATAGNLAASVLLVPKEVLKQRLQAGVWRGRAAMGSRGMYRGYKATLMRNVPSSIIRFAVYEELKARIKTARGVKKLAVGDCILAGGIAGALSSAIVTPLDVVKTRLTTGGSGAGVLGVMMHIFRTQGAGGLFVGVRARVLWAGLATAVGFGSYEVCKGWMMKFGSRKERGIVGVEVRGEEVAMRPTQREKEVAMKLAMGRAGLTICRRRRG